MLKAIGDIFSAVSKRVSGNLGDIITAGDPKSFLFKKGAETLFSRKFGGGGGGDIMDTRVTAPRFAAGKSMGFYTPSKARSSGTMGMQAKAVDPDTLRNDWFMRLRRYYTTKKYYS